MQTSTTRLAEGLRLDFTGEVSGFKQLSAFSDEVIGLIRNATGPKLLTVLDRGYGFAKPQPHVVRDHLNMTGFNPLVGPNDSCGERFPAVNEIYLTDLPGDFPLAIVAGLKPGVTPSAEDLQFIKSMGAEFYCYNLVPTMIVAAHAGWKVAAIVIPEGVKTLDVIKRAQLLGE
jgi:hypothetical protein